jgi:hypothetical protein
VAVSLLVLGGVSLMYVTVTTMHRCVQILSPVLVLLNIILRFLHYYGSLMHMQNAEFVNKINK